MPVVLFCRRSRVNVLRGRNGGPSVSPAQALPAGAASIQLGRRSTAPASSADATDLACDLCRVVCGYTGLFIGSIQRCVAFAPAWRVHLFGDTMRAFLCVGPIARKSSMGILIDTFLIHPLMGTCDDGGATRGRRLSKDEVCSLVRNERPFSPRTAWHRHDSVQPV